jgi:hypothetical protein
VENVCSTMQRTRLSSNSRSRLAFEEWAYAGEGGKI